MVETQHIFLTSYLAVFYLKSLLICMGHKFINLYRSHFWKIAQHIFLKYLAKWPLQTEFKPYLLKQVD